MFITINGQLGSGKSEICKILQRQGYEVFSTGRIQRQFANELGITTLQLIALGKTDASYDYIIDKKLVEYAEQHTGQKVVFDSRMAWNFVKGAFRVHLLVSPAIAADRVYCHRESKEETYKSKEEAMYGLIERRALECAQYKMLYNVNVADYDNYHLVLDTSTLTPPEVCDILLSEQAKFIAGEPCHSLYVSLQNIYPTRSFATLNKQRISAYQKQIEEGVSLAPVMLTRTKDTLFICDDHEKVVALLGSRAGIAPALIADSDTVSHLDEQITKEWEDVNGFTFAYHPAV